MAKNTNFGPDFGTFWPEFGHHNFFLVWILPVLDVRHYCKLLLYAISSKANESNFREWKKN